MYQNTKELTNKLSQIAIGTKITFTLIPAGDGTQYFLRGNVENPTELYKKIKEAGIENLIKSEDEVRDCCFYLGKFSNTDTKSPMDVAQKIVNIAKK
ncbi:MAG: hypothetical protein QW625_03085 [Candidatus Nanoarchaeia archaeon]